MLQRPRKLGSLHVLANSTDVVKEDPEPSQAANVTRGKVAVLTDAEDVGPVQNGNGKLRCWRPVNATTVSPEQSCPANCPFWARDVTGHESEKTSSCLFRCVKREQCGKIDANASVADINGMYCRRCRVEGCSECFGRGIDLCRRCRTGYFLQDYKCLSVYRTLWCALYIGVSLVLLFVLAWYMSLRARPIVNEEGLRQGVRFRSRTRLRCLKDGEESFTHPTKSLYPLSTNLLSFQAAGPSLPLFFRSQLVVIVWALLIACGWLVVVLLTDKSLLIMGLRRANTPRTMCYVVNWGHRLQLSLMGVKVRFLLAVYLGTFALSLLHAVWQMRSFQAFHGEATMKDYAALCSGVPETWNGAEAEAKLKQALEQSCGAELVGVSICWDFKHRSERITELINRDTMKEQRRRTSYSVARSRVSIMSRYHNFNDSEESQGFVAFRWINAALGFHHTDESWRTGSSKRDDDDSSNSSSEETSEEEVVGSLKHCGVAFVVFPTQASRDEAVSNMKRPAAPASGLKLQAMAIEPDAINWMNFSVSESQVVMRLSLGILIILLGLLVWITCFYVPYAYYVTSFQLAIGEQPGAVSRLVFAMLVVVGNQLMYFLCSGVAHSAGYKYNETEQMTYIVLYLGACALNVMLDILVTYYTTYTALVSTVTTFDGRPLETLSHMEIFESYPMQKALGGMLFWYAFPSCCLLPFIFEPIVTIVLPLHISELLVRSHPNIVGFAAEQALGYFSKMDFGRYADICLNMTIAAIMLFFPGGYILPIFVALALSHMYIYALDHWRVLRAVPGFSLTSREADRTFCAMMAIPTGIMAAAVIIKGHFTLHDLVPAASDSRIEAAVVGFFAHVALHWLLLFLVANVRLPGRLFATPAKMPEKTYAELARDVPCSWFSANPVHCLRSQCIHGDSPPWSHYVRGKEHLIVGNPSIGNYFQAPGRSRGESEQFSEQHVQDWQSATGTEEAGSEPEVSEDQVRASPRPNPRPRVRISDTQEEWHPG